MDAASIQKWYERNKQLMEFLAEQSREAKAPMTVSELSRVYLTKGTSSLSLASLKFKIARLRPRIPKLEAIDKETRVKMMFVLSGEIDNEYLNEMRKDATVEIDDLRRIIKYKSNDGKYEFQRDQSRASKTKHAKETLKKREETVDDSTEMAAQILSQISQMYSANQKKPKGVLDDQENFEEKEEVPCSSESKSYKRSVAYEEDDSIPTVSAKRFNDSNLCTSEDKREEDQIPINAEIFENVPIAESMEEVYTEYPLPSSYATIFQDGQSIQNKTTSHEFLIMMKYVVEVLNSSILSPLYHKINAKIEKFKENNIQIPIKDVLNTLLLVVRIVTKNDFLEASEENSTNLLEFLLTIRTASISLNSRELDYFEKELEKASKIVAEDQRISLEKVQSGLDFAIEYILP